MTISLLRDRGFSFVPAHGVLPSGACTCGPACHSPGKHPAGLWAKLPRGTQIPPEAGFNVAVLTGDRSGDLLVVDVDPGDETIEETLSRAGIDPDLLEGTLSCETPRRGRHYYLTAPGDARVTSAGDLGAGIDLRGDGGLVIAPPSVGRNGRDYAWIDPEAPVLPAPDLLVQRIRDVKRWRKACPGVLGGREVGEGKRHDAIVRWCGWLVGKDGVRYAPGSDDLRWAAGWASNAFLKPPLDAEELDSIVASTHGWEPGGSGTGDERDIVLGVDEEKVLGEAVAVLGGAPDVYQRGGEIVFAREGCLVPATRATMLARLSGAARWWIEDSKGGVRRAKPPPGVAAAVVERGAYPGVREIRAVVDGPFLSGLGVRTEPGFDERTGVFLSRGGPAPERMGKDEALEVLRDLTCDVPWEDEQSEAAWLAWCLSVLTRWCHRGNIPIGLFDASVPGSGKGLLISLAAVCAGEEPPSPSQWSRQTEEQEKVILSAARSGAGTLYLDDVQGTIGSPALYSALTSGRRWKGRILGGSRHYDGPLEVLFVATGNNLVSEIDLLRRGLLVRLTPDTNKPHLRSGFRYPNVLGHARKHRQRYQGALVSLVREYVRAGAPETTTPLGSFEDWNSVREIVVWATGVDPCGPREDGYDPLEEQQQDLLSAFVEYLRASGSRSSREVFSDLSSYDGDAKTRTAGLRRALSPSFVGDRPTPVGVGRQLGRIRGQVCDGYRVSYRRSSQRREWTLVPVRARS